MNQHLQKANDEYTKRNINFQQLLGWHLCYGIVLCLPEGFGLAFFSHSSAPDKPSEKDKSDTLFVTYCGGDMRLLLSNIHDQFKYISFERFFKNDERMRTFHVEQFKSKLP